MFENLSDRLSKVIKQVRGQAKITDDNVKDTLREVRLALLEADVALPVVKDFVERVRVRAIGAEVTESLSPGQVLIKIVNDELVAVFGGDFFQDGGDHFTWPTPLSPKIDQYRFF